MLIRIRSRRLITIPILLRRFRSSRGILTVKKGIASRIPANEGPPEGRFVYVRLPGVCIGWM